MGGGEGQAVGVCGSLQEKKHVGVDENQISRERFMMSGSSQRCIIPLEAQKDVALSSGNLTHPGYQQDSSSVTVRATNYCVVIDIR